MHKMKHRNVQLFDLLMELPISSIYVIVNHEDKRALVSIPKDPVAWVARQIKDRKMGMHRCGDTIEIDYFSVGPHEGNLKEMLRLAHKEECDRYIENGYIVFGAKTAVKYKVKYKVTQRGVLLCIETARGNMIWSKIFKKMKDAKSYKKDRSIEQLLSGI